MSEIDYYNNMTTNVIFEIIPLADGKQISMEYLTEELIANISQMVWPSEYVYEPFYDCLLLVLYS